MWVKKTQEDIQEDERKVRENRWGLKWPALVSGEALVILLLLDFGAYSGLFPISSGGFHKSLIATIVVPFALFLFVWITRAKTLPYCWRNREWLRLWSPLLIRMGFWIDVICTKCWKTSEQMPEFEKKCKCGGERDLLENWKWDGDTNTQPRVVRDRNAFLFVTLALPIVVLITLLFSQFLQKKAGG